MQVAVAASVLVQVLLPITKSPVTVADGMPLRPVPLLVSVNSSGVAPVVPTATCPKSKLLGVSWRAAVPDDPALPSPPSCPAAAYAAKAGARKQAPTAPPPRLRQSSNAVAVLTLETPGVPSEPRASLEQLVFLFQRLYACRLFQKLFRHTG